MSRLYTDSINVRRSVVLMAIPSKGRLVEPTVNLLQAIGIKLQSIDERALIISTSWHDLNVVRVRPEDIPSIVESGAAILGITGHDYVVESEANVEEVLDLGFGKGELVLAVPSSLKIEHPEDIPDGFRVATKYVNIAKKYFERIGKKVKIVKVSGSVEVMPLLGAADGIIDVTSTGTTLKLHGLKVIDKVLSSSARLIKPVSIDNNDAKYMINKIVTLTKSVLNSIGKRLILMNVPDEVLNNVLTVLPAMEGPMVARIVSGKPMWEVLTVVNEDELPDLIMKLKSRGAKDILVLSIEKVIP